MLSNTVKRIKMDESISSNETEIVKSPPVPNLEEICIQTMTSSSRTQSERLRQEMNPLENPVILSRLFEISPVSDLSKYRLVCKLWSRLALAHWRSSMKLVFSADAIYYINGYFWEDDDKVKSSLTTIEKFNKYVEDEENECALRPFRKFVLQEWEMKPKDVQVENLWRLCGPYITFLELNECTFHTTAVFQNIIYKACPQLKTLIIKVYKIRWPGPSPNQREKYTVPEFGEHKHLKCLEIDMDHEALPVSWLDMLSHFANLETIKVYNADQGDVVETMLKAVWIVRKHDKRKLRIKHLDILSASLYAQDVVPPEICSLLQSLQLPLESLTIDLGVETRESIVHDILDMHKGTLKKLDAYRGPISSLYPRFPFQVQLDCLEEIIMSDRICRDFTFMKFCPNLRKVHICDIVEDRPPIICTDIVTNTNVGDMTDVRMEKLVDLRVDYAVSNEDVENMCKWFPHVETLRMPLTNEQLHVVCEKWRSLVHLQILGNAVDDLGITGMTREFMENWKEGDNLPQDILPNLTDLKHLRTFNFQNEHMMETIASNLTEKSVMHGFLKMANLQSLKLTMRDITTKSKEAMKAKIADCDIVIILYNIDDDDIDI